MSYQRTIPGYTHIAEVAMSIGSLGEIFWLSDREAFDTLKKEMPYLKFQYEKMKPHGERYLINIGPVKLFHDFWGDPLIDRAFFDIYTPGDRSVEDDLGRVREILATVGYRSSRIEGRRRAWGTGEVCPVSA